MLGAPSLPHNLDQQLHHRATCQPIYADRWGRHLRGNVLADRETPTPRMKRPPLNCFMSFAVAWMHVPKMMVAAAVTTQ